MPEFDSCSSHKYFHHIIHFCMHLCLFFQLSWSCHAAVLPARWTDCPSHWRLQSRRLHGDVPWVTQLQGADALPGHHVSTSLSLRIYTLEAPLTLLKTVVISLCSQLCCVTFLCGWRIKRLFTANVDQYWLKHVQIFNVCSLISPATAALSTPSPDSRRSSILQRAQLLNWWRSTHVHLWCAAPILWEKRRSSLVSVSLNHWIYTFHISVCQEDPHVINFCNDMTRCFATTTLSFKKTGYLKQKQSQHKKNRAGKRDYFS